MVLAMSQIKWIMLVKMRKMITDFRRQRVLPLIQVNSIASATRAIAGSRKVRCYAEICNCSNLLQSYDTHVILGAGVRKRMQQQAEQVGGKRA